MLVFLDFEASSLSDRSYPIEVGWVFEDGSSEAHLIRPAPEWKDWDPTAERIHGIARQDLLDHGTDHTIVAGRMVEVLTGHDLCASAPSWDGKWLSALLRAAGWPRHTLRLRDTDSVLQDTAQAVLRPLLAPPQLQSAVANLLALSELRESPSPPAHRALPDAEQERARWIEVREAAETTARRMTEAARRSSARGELPPSASAGPPRDSGFKHMLGTEAGDGGCGGGGEDR